MFKRFWKGISFVEIILMLALCIAVVGFTIPNFQQYRCRSMQSEAQYTLYTLHALEKLYYSENHHYTPVAMLEKLKLFESKSRYYTIHTNNASDKHFLIEARGKAGTKVARDVWKISENKRLRHEREGCLL